MDWHGTTEHEPGAPSCSRKVIAQVKNVWRKRSGRTDSTPALSTVPVVFWLDTFGLLSAGVLLQPTEKSWLDLRGQRFCQIYQNLTLLQSGCRRTASILQPNSPCTKVNKTLNTCFYVVEGYYGWSRYSPTLTLILIAKLCVVGFCDHKSTSTATLPSGIKNHNRRTGLKQKVLTTDHRSAIHGGPAQILRRETWHCDPTEHYELKARISSCDAGLDLVHSCKGFFLHRKTYLLTRASAFCLVVLSVPYMVIVGLVLIMLRSSLQVHSRPGRLSKRTLCPCRHADFVELRVSSRVAISAW